MALNNAYAASVQYGIRLRNERMDIEGGGPSVDTSAYSKLGEKRYNGNAAIMYSVVPAAYHPVRLVDGGCGIYDIRHLVSERESLYK